MKERLDQSVWVGQREEVAPRNDVRVHADTLAQDLPLKPDWKQAVVSPNDRRGGHVGPCPDIARLTECDVCLVPRIGKNRGGIVRREVMEEVRLEIELGVVSHGVCGIGASGDRTGGLPPLSRRLSGCRHHGVHQDEPADGNPITSHHSAEAAHRLGHHDRLSTALDGGDDHCRIFGEPSFGIATWQVDRIRAMSSPFESRAHGSPKLGGDAACSGHKYEIRRGFLLALPPASCNPPDAASPAIQDTSEPRLSGHLRRVFWVWVSLCRLTTSLLSSRSPI
jgi:hypothetical protein